MSINDAGQITGYGGRDNDPNFVHAFVLTPAPPPLSAIISGTSIAKPLSGTADAIFTVTFNNSGNQPAAVNFNSANGTALAGTDYVATSGTLTFAPGITTQEVTVKILGGAPNSTNLSFSVKITSALDGGALATGVGTILIPAHPTKIVYAMTASPSSLSLGASSDASSVVTLQSQNGVSETAHLTVAWSGTAPSGVTFTLVPSDVTIPAQSSASALTTLSVATSASPSAGTFFLTVTALSASGVTTKPVDVTVTVTASSPPPGCCTSTGPFVDPAPGVNLDVKQDGTSSKGKYQVTASGANIQVVRVLDQKIMVKTQSSFWGFSPDEDRFVTSLVQDPIHQVALYDLTGANPQAPIWTSGDSTHSARIQFSPSGHYLFYTDVVGGPRTQLILVDAHTGTVEFTDSIQPFAGAPIQGESGDSFGTVGWGFGPKDSRFVYAYLSGQSNVQWNLVNLENGPAHAMVKNLPLLNDTSEYWQFSSCGEVIGIVRQPGQQLMDVEIYNTKNGTSAGPGAQLPIQPIQLSSTSASYVATTAGGSTTLGQNNPDCSISVSAHSPVDILLIDGQGRRCGFDSSSGTVVNQIPGGSYTGTGTEPQTITVPYAAGTYQIEAYGLPSLTAPAPYRLSIVTANESDAIDEHDIAGMASSETLQQFVFTLDGNLTVTDLSPSDKTPPIITPIVTGTSGNNGWYVSDVAVAWNVTDGQSPIQSTSGCGSVSVNSDTPGTTFTCTATSAGGTASNSFTVKRDTAPPTIACGSPDGLWHASDVSIACTANDGVSGLAGSATASFALTTAVPAGTETANAATGSIKVCDVASNCANAGPTGGNMIDKKAPAIVLTTPGNGAIYSAHQAVNASYSCSDNGSGVASCAGTVANGAKIDTTPNGISTSKTFTVKSADKVGNAASQLGNYVISCHYVGIGISPPTVTRKGAVTVSADVMSCTSSSQSISVKFEVTGPRNSNSCGSTKTLMFTTPPFTIPPNTSKAISFPFIVPKTMCTGTYSVTSTTLMNGTAVDATTATLTVQ